MLVYKMNNGKYICYLECLLGYFGVVCSESCSGNCVNNMICYYINGVCFSGC